MIINHSISKLGSFASARYLGFGMHTLRGFLVAGALGKEAFGLYSVVINAAAIRYVWFRVRESVSMRLATLGEQDDRYSKLCNAAFWFSVSIVVFLSMLSLGLMMLEKVLDLRSWSVQLALLACLRWARKY